MKLRWLALGLVVLALLVPAVMVTVTRLVEPTGGRWIRLVSFTPHVIVLYLLALLLLVVAVVAGRGLGRRASGSVGALVLALLALHLFWLSELYVGEQASAQGETLTVMAANLSFGDADPGSVVELAKEQGVDVVVFVEITDDARDGLLRAGLGERFPHAEGESVDGVFGTMVFSRYRISGVTALDTKFRGFSMRVRAPGGGIDLIAVHPPPPMLDATQWRADHDAIRQAAAAATGPTVIAGDLNATLDHLPMRELEGRGFADAAAEANSGWQPTWPDADRVSLLGIRVPTILAIDHVLTDDGFDAVQTETSQVPGTDHRALVATLVRR
jgi:endonuclease/exonuclease/phosphatase (EEP) superfamily protein YafD